MDKFDVMPRGFLFCFAICLITITSCKPDVEGCTDPKGDNYNPQATVEDSSCTYTLLGITDADSDTTAIVLGCTDTAAANYDPKATEDDGSCEFPGCTDPNAENYDPNANVDDGSCIDVREKFAGTWDVSNDCGVFQVSSPQTISYDSTVTDTIVFSPFTALGDAFALVNGFDVTMPSQTSALGPITVSFSGAGKLNSAKNSLSLTLTYDAGLIGSGTCVANYTKQ